MFIVKLITFGTDIIGSPPIWADGTKAHKIVLMCIDAIKSKYQLSNKCKLLFDLVVHQQQHLRCFWQHSSSFGKDCENFTKCHFYFVTQFMSKCNFYIEMEGVYCKSMVLRKFGEAWRIGYVMVVSYELLQ